MTRLHFRVGYFLTLERYFATSIPSSCDGVADPLHGQVTVCVEPCHRVVNVDISAGDFFIHRSIQMTRFAFVFSCRHFFYSRVLFGRVATCSRELDNDPASRLLEIAQALNLASS